MLHFQTNLRPRIALGVISRGDLVYEKKYGIDFDIAPIDGIRFTSNPGMINGLDFGPSRLCLLQNCVFYGYSEFDGVKRGSRASYNINNK